MAITHGASGTATVHGGGTGTCIVTLTLTAGRSYLVFASGQGSGGSRTLTAASSVDGALGTAKVTTGSAADPGYCWLVQSTVGGVGATVTITPSGNMFSIHCLVQEYIGGTLTFDNGVALAQTTASPFDSGSVSCAHADDLSVGFAYSHNRNDLNTNGTAGNDGQGNNYSFTGTLGTTDATNGDSTRQEDILTQIAAASRKATYTPQAACSGMMIFGGFYIAASGLTVSVTDNVGATEPASLDLGLGTFQDEALITMTDAITALISIVTGTNLSGTIGRFLRLGRRRASLCLAFLFLPFFWG